MKKMVQLVLMLNVVTAAIYLNGCGVSNAAKGGAIGTVAGGGLGAIIGDKPGREKEGAIIGAVIGGAVGTYIGNRMDQQAAQLEEIPGVQDVNVNKEEGNQLIEATMQVNFDWDDDRIKAVEKPKLDQLAAVLSDYPENIVLIEGHTDSDGEEEYNQDLSERRANSIKTYLQQKNLNIAGLSSVGYGETRPIASNDTAYGKAQNRRVEIKISIDSERAQQLYDAQQTQP